MRAAHAAEERQKRGFPEALIIDGRIPDLRTDSAKGATNAGEVARIHRPDFRGEAAGRRQAEPTADE